MINLEALVNPNSVAVIGASPTSDLGQISQENLRALNFGGRLYPVNPKYDEILGTKCYPSILDIPEPVDAAIIVLSARASVPVLREAAESGVRAAVIPATAFAAMGEEGRRLQSELAEIAHEKNLALLGPNCMGILNMTKSVGLYVGGLPKSLRRGPIGGVLQSGSICEALVNHGGRLGFSYLFSSGNEVYLSKEDLIEFLLADDDTRVIVCFIEGIQHPDRFVALAERALAIGKPIIAMKIGRSEAAQQIAVGHTGALAGSDRVFDAICRQKGIIRVHDLDEMMETAALFAGGRLPAGDGVGAMTFSGGEAATLLDLGDELGVKLPAFSPEILSRMREALPNFVNPVNPLDPWGTAPEEQFIPVCLNAMGDDPKVHTVLLSIDLPAYHLADEHQAAMTTARQALLLAQRVDKPVLFSSNISGPLDAGVLDLLRDHLAVLQGTRETMLAVRSLARYAELRRRRAGDPPEADPRQAEQALEHLAAAEGDLLDEVTSKRLLAAFGIPVADDRLVTSADEAVAQAEALGYPVALKVAGPIPHKTDTGGVLLNLADAKAVQQGYHAILASVGARLPAATVKGMLVSPMITGGFETIVGVSFDPQFGPMVAFGLGGIYAEVLDDVALRQAPLTGTDADEMLREIHGYPLLAGMRGRPPADLGAARQVLLQLSQMAVALKDHIREIDVNPLLLRENGAGAVAADAMIVRR